MILEVRSIVLFFFLICLFSCEKGKQRQIHKLSGPALGTTYNITIQSQSRERIDFNVIEEIIQNEINTINEAFSNWDYQSEISKLNRIGSNIPMNVSKDFMFVFQKSLHIYNLSNRKFDPAQSELFRLWGFGVNSNFQNKHVRFANSIPSTNLIYETKMNSGMKQYIVSGNTIQKKNSIVKLNFSAIAKGYLVDKIFQKLYKRHTAIMVEIGGEVRTGDYIEDIPEDQNLARQKHWKIGIEKPVYSNQQKIFKIAKLKNMAMASSGDYRNYFTIKGDDKKIKYSHILDPITGYPVSTNIRSVTVVGQECMVADALATTLFTMEPLNGFKLIKKFPGYEAMIILENQSKTNGKYVVQMTADMKYYFVKD